MDFSRCLTIDEVLTVIRDLRPRAIRQQGYKMGAILSRSAFLNLAIFRLSCCCGLRRSEMSQLKIKDVILTGPRPCLRLRRETVKGKRKARIVPLWWDAGTLDDLKRWIEFRKSNLPGPDGGACTPEATVLAGISAQSLGKQIQPNKLAARWQTCLKILGDERRRQINVHAGRHTFASLSLQAGRSLLEVRDALGHASINTTSIYLHAIETKDVPDVFDEGEGG